MILKLTFDPTDAADSHNVGAYLRSSDGTLLTHTNVGGKDSLDVNVTNDLTVDLDHTEDSVKIGDGVEFLEVNADGSINAVVTATDLDIRDLTHATDSTKIGDGTDFLEVNADGSINSVVTATDLDIRDLTSATDSVTSKTLTPSTHTVSRVAVPATTATQVDTGLANRKYVTLQNLSGKDAWIGTANTVTAATGFYLPRESAPETFEAGPGCAYYVYADTPVDIAVYESATA